MFCMEYICMYIQIYNDVCIIYIYYVCVCMCILYMVLWIIPVMVFLPNITLFMYSMCAWIVCMGGYICVCIYACTGISRHLCSACVKRWRCLLSGSSLILYAWLQVSVERICLASYFRATCQTCCRTNNQTRSTHSTGKKKFICFWYCNIRRCKVTCIYLWSY